MSITQVNGVGLWAETQGSSGHPVVMVHGSWGDHHNWDLVAPRLAEDHVVLTYDRRGHSQSERPSAQGSVHEDVGDLAALIEQHDFAPAVVIGNSFGAIISLRLAAQRPELIRSLVVHEPPLVGLIAPDPAMEPIVQAVAARLGGVVELLNEGDMPGAARKFVEEVGFGPGAWDLLPPESRDTFINNAPTFLDESNEPDALNLDLATLANYRGPTLLTQGDASPPMFSPINQRVGDAIPGVTRHTFTGAGHVPHMTHPDDYLNVVSAFIV